MAQKVAEFLSNTGILRPIDKNDRRQIEGRCHNGQQGKVKHGRRINDPKQSEVKVER